MKLSEKLNNSRKLRLLAAVLLNAVFLACTLLIVKVGFEANDDLTLAAFVDGQMSEMSAHIPYINIVLGCIMKGIYTVLGQSIAWHTAGQYLLMFAGFCCVSFVLFERLRPVQAAGVSIILLLFFGVDVYTLISYTKTAAVCTVGGMLLLLHTMESMEKGRRTASIIVGVLLCVFGFMLRPMEFLPCFGIMAVIALRRLYALIFDEKGSAGEKMRRFVSYAAPFAVVVILAGVLNAVNEAAWSGDRWGFYHDFDAVRVAYSDYGRPEYDEMPEAYEALGLSETSVQLLYEGNYFDPDVFNAELMESISTVRDENFPAPSVGVCLGMFLDKCIPGFFVNLHVYGFLIMLALWLSCGEHKLKDWLTLAGVCGLFALMYMYLVYRGRYLVDRVDVGLFFAVSAAMSYMLSREKLDREKNLAGLLFILALGTSWYLTRDNYRSVGREDLSAERAAVDTLLSDTEHVYLAKLDTVSDRIYSPFEPAGKGYWDRIVLLGGWDCNHPVIMDNLKKYGVENPYRDSVGNDKVYFIEDNIELTLAHIREFYDSDAAAELAEPLSSETGLSIYRILD